MAKYNREAPYVQSRAAQRQIYGPRSIDASAPQAKPTGYAPAPGGQGGLSSEASWRAFFGPKKETTTPAAPMLWDKIRNNLTSKPVSDEVWGKLRQDMNPMRNIGLPQQTQTTAQLAPEDAPDVSSMASFYEPPPQLGGPKSLLMDPEGFASMDNSPIGGSSAFMKKYGRMRDLSTLGQENWML